MFDNARTSKSHHANTSLQIYKKEIRSAKRSNWRIFCESIESAAEASRLYKFFSISPQSSCLLTKTNGSWTDSGKESWNLLLNTHFAGSEPAEKTMLDTCLNARVKHEVITDKTFTPEKLRLKTLGNYLG